MIDLRAFQNVAVFTGAGMSAESGVPTYRGAGGIWSEYRWEEYACQRAFDRDPERVWDFHDKRRAAVAACTPHEGHRIVAEMERTLPRVTVITQNIDGMHQRAGSRNVIELHGSLWRVRCSREGTRSAALEMPLPSRRCACGAWLRPDIVWFADPVGVEEFGRAESVLVTCDLLIAIGTSAVVYPAAGLPSIAAQRRIPMIEINPEDTPASHMYAHRMRGTASECLARLWNAA